MHNTLVIITGPTASGKTDLSVELADYFHSEIISADSRQFYREMSIGTSVPSEDQLRRVKHHFVRFLSVTQYYSASLFERDVLNLLPSLFRKNPVVFMVGGSGLYIDAVCKGFNTIPDVDPEVREKYLRIFNEEGIEKLRLILKVLDPEYYRQVDLRNPRRLLRALEICETAGRPYSSFLKKEKRPRDFRIIKTGLELPRGELYRRIDTRVDRMIEEGLAEEARSLANYRNFPALNTLGYKELFAFFDGSITFEAAVSLIKRNSRRYARKQISWWARDKEIRWFHPAEKEKILKFIETELKHEGGF